MLVATTNRGKLAELSVMLDLDINWLTLADFPDIAEVPEDGKTFEENAEKKALGYAKAARCWTIADDSGLVIDCLDGAPGVNSARFSGRKLPDQDRTLIDHRNIEKVLKLMQNVPPEKRTARFVCSLCLATPKKVLIRTKGIIKGAITDKPAGQNGFGYDPIFFIPALNKTAAQISPHEKNALSHRHKAIAKLKPLLITLLQNKLNKHQSPESS